MTGRGHLKVSFLISLPHYLEMSIDQSLLFIIGVLVGSIAPDKMEMGRLIPHRGITHWFPLWFIGLASAFFLIGT